MDFEKIERIRSLVLWALITFVSILFLTAMGHMLIEWQNNIDVVVDTTKATILSADLSSQSELTVDATFCLGRGELESKEYFVTYEQNNDGSVSFAKYPCENTVFYTTLSADATAHVEKDINKYGDVIAYRLYLPEGSVVHTYDLSLSN